MSESVTVTASVTGPASGRAVTCDAEPEAQSRPQISTSESELSDLTQDFLRVATANLKTNDACPEAVRSLMIIIPGR